jgi:hypothetical protein
MPPSPKRNKIGMRVPQRPWPGYAVHALLWFVPCTVLGVDEPSRLSCGVAYETTAGAAGIFKLGDLTVNRMGFGAMRLSQRGRAFAADNTGSEPVLRACSEQGIAFVLDPASQA